MYRLRSPLNTAFYTPASVQVHHSISLYIETIHQVIRKNLPDNFCITYKICAEYIVPLSMLPYSSQSSCICTRL